MGRAPCCAKVGLRRGRWTAEEDQILSNYIHVHGEGSWRSLPKNAGLLRCGKSCRLRWINYLRADLKRGNISAEEEELILKLHASLGNRWSLIAGHLAGRTDNEIKNYWNSHLSRKFTPSSPTIPTKRRSTSTKIKKPRKKTSTPSSEPQTNMLDPSVGGGGEVKHDPSTSGVEREKENGFDECFYDESLLMDPNMVLPLTEQDDMTNHINSSSPSTNDSSQVNQVDWGWEWNFEDGDSMLGLGLGFGVGVGVEEDDIISWPWDQTPEEEQVGVDVQKQDAMIAWLLS